MKGMENAYGVNLEKYVKESIQQIQTEDIIDLFRVMMYSIKSKLVKLFPAAYIQPYFRIS